MNTDIIKIMYELIIALKNIHKNGVAHQDIKCANILLDKNNKAFIGDFGLAKICDEDIVSNGTSSYFPQELINKTYSRKKLDLYALLLCFVSMVEGAEVRFTSIKPKDPNKVLMKCLRGNRKELYTNFDKLKKFDEKVVKGFYDIFKNIIIDKDYNDLSWENFLETEFWKNLEVKYQL